VYRHRLGDQLHHSVGQILAGTGVVKPMDKVDELLVDTVFAQEELRCAERPVDLVKFEKGWVIEYFGQALRVGETAAVLRWCGAPTVDRGCGRGVGACREVLLESDRQLPGVTVVVQVVQDVPGLLQGLVEPYFGRGEPAVVLPFALLHVVRAQEQLTVFVERIPAEGEAMEMGVGPVDGYLQHLMYDVERQVRAQIQPPPDRWLGVIKVHPDPIDLDLISRWAAGA
jgi:hypothetical protein